MQKTRSPARLDLMWGLLRGFIWMDRCLQENLALHGWARISRTESQIMLFIAAGVTRPVEIANALGLSRQAVNQTTRQLVSRGLVALETDPEDGRCKVLSFAPDGEPMRVDALRIIGEMERELEKRLGKRLLDSLRTGLRKDWGELLILDATGT